VNPRNEERILRSRRSIPRNKVRIPRSEEVIPRNKEIFPRSRRIHEMRSRGAGENPLNDDKIPQSKNTENND